MIDKYGIINYIEENDLEDIKEIKITDELVILKFNYLFDKFEIESAEAFADEECTDKHSEEWYYDFYLPYLSDIAIDNVEEIIEECAEDRKLEYQLIALDLSPEQQEESVFMAAFYHKGINVELEDYLIEII